MIKFNDNYNTGIAVIDAQHKELFSIVNKFEIALRENNLSLLRSTFEELLKYSRYHFITEEVFLSDLEKAIFERHVSLHRNMQSDVIGFKDRIEKTDNPIPLFNDLFDLTKNWIIDHILNEDAVIKQISHKF